MNLGRPYSPFLFAACFVAAFAYILHRGWIPALSKSKTPWADTVFVFLLGLSGEPITRVFVWLGVRPLGISILLTTALLFLVAYGHAILNGDRQHRVELSRRFGCSMVLCYMIFLIVHSAYGVN
jgi:hypothetical protein